MTTLGLWARTHLQSRSASAEPQPREVAPGSVFSLTEQASVVGYLPRSWVVLLLHAGAPKYCRRTQCYLVQVLILL